MIPGLCLAVMTAKRLLGQDFAPEDIIEVQWKSLHSVPHSDAEMISSSSFSCVNQVAQSCGTKLLNREFAPAGFRRPSSVNWEGFCGSSVMCSYVPVLRCALVRCSCTDCGKTAAGGSALEQTTHAMSCTELPFRWPSLHAWSCEHLQARIHFLALLLLDVPSSTPSFRLSLLRPSFRREGGLQERMPNGLPLLPRVDCAPELLSFRAVTYSARLHSPRHTRPMCAASDTAGTRA